ncbi:MAG: IS4 family transposase [Methanobacteriota archaeon]|nr:MAG: IS4 family transposase [Euryarchaeota archaeon]
MSKKLMSTLYQICKYIPQNLVPQLARKYGVHKKSRTFTPWSHVVSMLYAHLGHCLSLNDVVDGLRLHSGYLKAIRHAVAPSRNGLSYANMNRDADMAEELFWSVLEHLKQLNPRFGYGHGYAGLPRRFKRTINIIDSTTIRLAINCIDWATHRRRKAAVKAHVNLNIQTFLPSVVVLGKAAQHDSTKVRTLCAGMKAGEIMVADKAYVKFKYLHELAERGIFWVLRAKDNMKYKIISQKESNNERILCDAEIQLTVDQTFQDYPQSFRLIRAIVKVNNQDKIMTFITNNMQWAPSSICDLYKSRWAIEVFFKQMKQTLQLKDFLGNSENAVRWQIWTAMLACILLRFIKDVAKWTGSFTRLFTCVRAALWCRADLYELLRTCLRRRTKPRPEQIYLPGFEPGVLL